MNNSLLEAGVILRSVIERVQADHDRYKQRDDAKQTYVNYKAQILNDLKKVEETYTSLNITPALEALQDKINSTLKEDNSICTFLITLNVKPPTNNHIFFIQLNMFRYE